MKIFLETATRLRVENAPGALSIDAPSVARQYEPFDMLASALAVCTHAVLSSWAQQAALDAARLVVTVEWNVDDDHRIKNITVLFDWPTLPPERLKAAERAASLCSVHKTLSHSPSITIASAAR